MDVYRRHKKRVTVITRRVYGANCARACVCAHSSQNGGKIQCSSYIYPNIAATTISRRAHRAGVFILQKYNIIFRSLCESKKRGIPFDIDL